MRLNPRSKCAEAPAAALPTPPRLQKQKRLAPSVGSVRQGEPMATGASSGGKRAAPTKEKEQQNVGEEVGTPAAKRACRAESACSSGSNAALATGSSPAREQGLLDCLRQLARNQGVAVVCTNKDGNKKVGKFLGGHARAEIYVRCLGSCCESKPFTLDSEGGCIMTASAFEIHAGRGSSKNWRESLRVNEATGQGSVPLSKWFIADSRKIEEKAGGLVGQRVAVYWPREEMWYPGVVKEFRKEEGSGRLRRGGKYGHFISYDDQRGDGWHLLPQEIWRRLREQSGPQEVLSAVREGRAAPAAGSELDGRRIEVWWEKEKAWFPGLLEGYRARDGRHFISYDDGDSGWSFLAKEKWRLLPKQGSAPAAALQVSKAAAEMGTSEVAKSLEESVPEAESREGGATEAESREGGTGVSPGQDSLPTTVLQASESAATEAGAPGPAELPDSSFAALNQQCIQHWDRSLGLADACSACAERLRQLRAPQRSLMEWSESGDEAPVRASLSTADGSLGGCSRLTT